MTTNGLSTLQEAVRSEESTRWEAAIREEIENLKAHGTWQLVEPNQVAKGHVPITTRMTLVKKHDRNGKLTRYKGRLVAHGFKQRPGVNFDETYALLVSLAAVRVALSYAAAMDLEIRQLDVIGACLESKINETLYISFPKGLVREGNKIILDPGEFINGSREPAIDRLIWRIYGTRQAAVNWYKCFDEILIRLGFMRSNAEAGIYMRGRLILLIWVDDILAIGMKEDVDKITRELKEELNIKDMGELKEGTFLGMTVRRKCGDRRIYLGQRGYINKILERFGMDKANEVSTPIENGVKFNKRETDEEKADRQRYQELIGSVNYAAVATRADITYAVGLLGLFALDLSTSHQLGTKRLLRYLKKTATFELCLGNRNVGTKAAIYADADYAGDLTEKLSTSGIVVRDRNGATVAWKSTKQPITTRSTAGAEFIATAMAMEFILLSNLEKEFYRDHNDEPVPVDNDNEACVTNINSGDHQTQSHHAGVRYHRIRYRVRLGEATLTHIPGDQMPADSLTKGLDRTKHQTFLEFIGLR